MCIRDRTIDDAAGEAIDKCSKVMGLGYPGGPIIEIGRASCRERVGYTIKDTSELMGSLSVSYTHLDVYKRQTLYIIG